MYGEDLIGVALVRDFFELLWELRVLFFPFMKSLFLSMVLASFLAACFMIWEYSKTKETKEA